MPTIRKPSANKNLNNISSSELVKQEDIKANVNSTSKIRDKKEILDVNKLIPLSMASA